MPMRRTVSRKVSPASSRRADPLDRLNVGKRGHRLAAHMEADTEPIGHLTGCLQQLGSISQVDPKFRREAQLGIF